MQIIQNGFYKCPLIYQNFYNINLYYMSNGLFSNNQTQNLHLIFYQDYSYEYKQDDPCVQSYNLNFGCSQQSMFCHLAQHPLEKQQIQKQPMENEDQLDVNQEISKLTKIHMVQAPQIRQLDLLQQNQNTNQSKLTQKDKRIEMKFRAYNQGHLDYYATFKLPIFGLSRKYERPKKKDASEFKFMKRRLNHLKDFKKAQIKHVKRLDKQYYDKYLSLIIEERQETDITFSALKNLQKQKNNQQNNKILEKIKLKYEQKRHWAQYLSTLVKHQDKIDFDPAW